MSTTDPAATLRAMATGFRLSRALHAAAELGLADLLADGPRPAAELAQATGTAPGPLFRLMRALAAAGVFAEVSSGIFGPTALSERLSKGTLGSVRDAVLFAASDLRWRMWGDLMGSLTSGTSAPERLLGRTVFEHYADHPGDAAVHVGAMAAMTAAASRAVLDAYDFSPFRLAMDLGGGNGRFLAEILAATPGLRGVLLDLPHVAAAAGRMLEQAGLAARCDIHGGSFFDPLPPGADLVLLKQVIHDWDDARSLAILRACRVAMAGGGTLLLVERVLPDLAEPGPIEPYTTDLEMLVMTPGGLERSAAEYRALLAEAGFKLNRVVPTASVLGLLEAVPA